MADDSMAFTDWIGNRAGKIFYARWWSRCWPGSWITKHLDSQVRGCTNGARHGRHIETAIESARCTPGLARWV